MPGEQRASNNGVSQLGCCFWYDMIGHSYIESAWVLVRPEGSRRVAQGWTINPVAFVAFLLVKLTSVPSPLSLVLFLGGFHSSRGGLPYEYLFLKLSQRQSPTQIQWNTHAPTMTIMPYINAVLTTKPVSLILPRSYLFEVVWAYQKLLISIYTICSPPYDLADIFSCSRPPSIPEHTRCVSAIVILKSYLLSRKALVHPKPPEKRSLPVGSLGGFKVKRITFRYWVNTESCISLIYGVTR